MKYVIEKGSHRSGYYFNPLPVCNVIEHNVAFNNTALYNINTIDQYDINKLFGIGYINHHWNSARFGWRSQLDGTIEILAYVYNNGRRINEWDETISICKILPNRLYTMKLCILKHHYKFIVMQGKNIIGIVAIRRPKVPKLFGYKLYPYFGGNCTAPHDILIQLF